MGRPLAEQKLKRIDVYVEPAIEKALARAAANDDRTLSNYVARVLSEYVEEYLSPRKKE
jgi:uncharacterized protein (DUF1778 family)